MDKTQNGLMTYWSDFRRLRLDDGTIYRAWYNRKGKVSRWQVVLPASLKKECLEAGHVKGTGDHVGVASTARRVQRRFFWSTLMNDVWLHVRTCRGCAHGIRRRNGRLEMQNSVRRCESIVSTADKTPAEDGTRAVDEFNRCAKITPRSWFTAEPTPRQGASVRAHTEEPEIAMVARPGVDASAHVNENDAASEVQEEARDEGRPPSTRAPTGTIAAPDIRRRSPRNVRLLKRHLQRGQLEEERVRTVYRLHTLRSC